MIVMLISLYLEELFDMVLQRTPLRNSTRLRRGHAEWKAGSTLQLQRIAHENLGFGTWKRADESIPVTNKGDILGTYKIDDEKHVRLVNLSDERKALNDYHTVPVAERQDEEIAYPSTRLGEHLGSYDPTDPNHTRLVKPTEPASNAHSASTEHPSVHVSPTGMAGMNTDDTNTFNVSLPVLNFSDLSLPDAVSSQANHYNVLFPDMDSANTNHPGEDLPDQDLIDQNLTHADLELSDLTYSNFDDPTTTLINYQHTDVYTADPRLQYTDVDVSEDDLPGDDIARSEISDHSVPMSAFSSTRARGRYSRIQSNEHCSTR